MQEDTSDAIAVMLHTPAPVHMLSQGSARLSTPRRDGETSAVLSSLRSIVHRVPGSQTEDEVASGVAMVSSAVVRSPAIRLRRSEPGHLQLPFYKEGNASCTAVQISEMKVGDCTRAQDAVAAYVAQTMSMMMDKAAASKALPHTSHVDATTSVSDADAPSVGKCKAKAYVDEGEHISHDLDTAAPPSVNSLSAPVDNACLSGADIVQPVLLDNAGIRSVECAQFVKGRMVDVGTATVESSLYSSAGPAFAVGVADSTPGLQPVISSVEGDSILYHTRTKADEHHKKTCHQEQHADLDIALVRHISQTSRLRQQLDASERTISELRALPIVHGGFAAPEAHDKKIGIGMINASQAPRNRVTTQLQGKQVQSNQAASARRQRPGKEAPDQPLPRAPVKANGRHNVLRASMVPEHCKQHTDMETSVSLMRSTLEQVRSLHKQLSSGTLSHGDASRARLLQDGADACSAFYCAAAEFHAANQASFALSEVDEDEIHGRHAPEVHAVHVMRKQLESFEGLFTSVARQFDGQVAYSSSTSHRMRDKTVAGFSAGTHSDRYAVPRPFAESSPAPVISRHSRARQRIRPGSEVQDARRIENSIEVSETQSAVRRGSDVYQDLLKEVATLVRGCKAALIAKEPPVIDGRPVPLEKEDLSTVPRPVDDSLTSEVVVTRQHAESSPLGQHELSTTLPIPQQVTVPCATTHAASHPTSSDQHASSDLIQTQIARSHWATCSKESCGVQTDDLSREGEVVSVSSPLAFTLLSDEKGVTVPATHMAFTDNQSNASPTVVRSCSPGVEKASSNSTEQHPCTQARTLAATKSPADINASVTLDSLAQAAQQQADNLRADWLEMERVRQSKVAQQCAALLKVQQDTFTDQQRLQSELQDARREVETMQLQRMRTQHQQQLLHRRNVHASEMNRLRQQRLHIVKDRAAGRIQSFFRQHLALRRRTSEVNASVSVCAERELRCAREARCALSRAAMQQTLVADIALSCALPTAFAKTHSAVPATANGVTEEDDSALIELVCRAVLDELNHEAGALSSSQPFTSGTPAPQSSNTCPVPVVQPAVPTATPLIKAAQSGSNHELALHSPNGTCSPCRLGSLQPPTRLAPVLTVDTEPLRQIDGPAASGSQQMPLDVGAARFTSESGTRQTDKGCMTEHLECLVENGDALDRPASLGATVQLCAVTSQLEHAVTQLHACRERQELMYGLESARALGKEIASTLVAKLPATAAARPRRRRHVRQMSAKASSTDEQHSKDGQRHNNLKYEQRHTDVLPDAELSRPKVHPQVLDPICVTGLKTCVASISDGEVIHVASEGELDYTASDGEIVACLPNSSACAQYERGMHIAHGNVDLSEGEV